ncbi:tubby C-terminal-like domain-containing protein, partial [Pavlovales sp. CCMP2436]
ETKLLTLNFFERASCPSSRNFQLTLFGAPDKSVLLFGKRSEDIYSLDFMAPLSPFAAFGIALSVHDW